MTWLDDEDLPTPQDVVAGIFLAVLLALVVAIVAVAQ